MATVNWRIILGWSDEQLEELRFSGFSFLREGLYQKAIIFFKALVTLDPASIYDTQTLGALYLQVGDGKKALATLNQALELDAAHAPTQINKVKALLMLGEKTEAMQLAKILQTHADPTIADDATALLIAYR